MDFLIIVRKELTKILVKKNKKNDMIRLKRLQCNLATPTAVCKEVLKSMSILTQTAGGPQRTMDVNSPIVQLIH